MICVPPSWITALPPTGQLTTSGNQPEQNCETSGTPTLETNFALSDLKTTASLLRLRNVDSSSRLTRPTQIQREFSRDSSCKNGRQERSCTPVANKSFRKRSLKHKGSTLKKQQKIKTLLKWIQISGKKANEKCKTVKNTTNTQKKQTNRKPETLLELLSKKESTRAFRLFLTKEMSEENLDFWLEVESYKRQTSENQKRLAPIVFNNFVASGSANEVNIDSYTRKLTKESVKTPHATTFDLAQSQIFKLMESDSFRRFLKRL